MWFFKKKKNKKVTVEEKQVVEPKVEVEKESKVETKPVEKQVVANENISKEKTTKVPKYHVSQNKEANTANFKKWRVRKEGSSKTIKFFETQKDAIEFAETLAESAGSSVVIHKIDGSIRKQDYAKKA
jgi:uncharacterized protein YdaT